LVEPPDESDYARVAVELDLRRNTLAVAVHRLRHRLRELVREELSQTIAGRGDMQQELRALRGSMDHCLGPAP
ncbi:MAG TPA: helix-turn-helix domain-containing protein, partial [Rhodanobacteraceae bacterium]|nr:helix-turn-helix domain-containing protein [Rhodanobacteraceae bacterium]